MKGIRTLRSEYLALVVGILLGVLEAWRIALNLDGPFIPDYYVYLALLEIVFWGYPILITGLILSYTIMRDAVLIPRYNRTSSFNANVLDVVISDSKNQFEIPSLLRIFKIHMITLGAFLVGAVLRGVILMQWTSVVAGFRMGFNFNWRNAIVILGMLSILWILFALYARVFRKIYVSNVRYVRFLLTMLLMGIVFTLTYPIVEFAYIMLNLRID